MLATLLPAQRLLDRTQTLDFIAPLQGSVGVSFTRLPGGIFRPGKAEEAKCSRST